MKSFKPLIINEQLKAKIKAHIPPISDKALELYANINLIGAACEHELTSGDDRKLPSIRANYIENIDDATDEALAIYINDEKQMEIGIKDWNPEDISATNLGTHMTLNALKQYNAKQQLA